MIGYFLLWDVSFKDIFSYRLKNQYNHIPIQCGRIHATRDSKHCRTLIICRPYMMQNSSNEHNLSLIKCYWNSTEFSRQNFFTWNKTSGRSLPSASAAAIRGRLFHSAALNNNCKTITILASTWARRLVNLVRSMVWSSSCLSVLCHGFGKTSRC